MTTLLHVGYHKTGTTWLQKHLFGVEAFGYATPFRKNREVRDLLVQPNGLDFDPAATRAAFQPTFEALHRRGLVAVISAERLSGNPHFGGGDTRELADRLHATFPEAKVLIGIREQESMLLSCYQQYIRAGGGLSLRRYLTMSSGLQSGAPVFSFDHFCYDRAAAHYRACFGDDRVLVLPLETLRREPQAYVAAIARFCGTDETVRPDFADERNRAPSDLALAVKRLINPFAARDTLFGQNPLRVSWLDRPARRAVRLVDRLPLKAWNRRRRQRLTAIVRETMARAGVDYGASNARTQAYCPVDLAALGYRMQR